MTPAEEHPEKQTSQLAVFDVDGTLTDTNRVDERCFLAAAESALGLRGISADWAAYTHCTDAGVLEEALAKHQGRLPTPSDLKAFIGEFVRALESAYSEEPEEFAPIPGAASAIRALHTSDSWSVAIATGGWGASARLKLRLASIPVEGLPFASSDDSPSREEIIRAAIRRATERSGIGSYQRIVLLGDAIWDLRAARNLDLPFLGVGTGRRAEELRSAGATALLPDFRDFPAVLRELASATVPDLKQDEQSTSS